MELLFTLLVVVFILWVGGFLTSLRKASGMANLEISKAAAIHKARTINKLSQLDVEEESVTKAKTIMTLMDSIEL